MNSTALRGRYLTDTIATASPARLLTMLYDRLLRDVSEAEDALAAGAPERADIALRHAQEIVIELVTSLDLSAWPAGESLAHVYRFLLSELIGANVHKDSGRVTGCLRLIQPLRETWHEAAALTASDAAAPVSA